jgi:hypothetical protein
MPHTQRSALLTTLASSPITPEQGKWFYVAVPIIILTALENSDRTAKALVLRSCRRFQAGEQTTLSQGALGKQFVEMLDAACGMEVLIERIVQAANAHRGFLAMRTDLL